jgi:hypothetical protein
MYGTIVLIAAGLLLLVGCPSETSSGDTPSLLGTPNVKDAPAWESGATFVKDRDEAAELLNGFLLKCYSTLRSSLTAADSDAFEAAFKESNGMTVDAYTKAKALEKSVSYSQKINDTTVLAKAIGDGVQASIKGSSSGKFSSNKPLGSVLMSAVGDTSSSSIKVSRTFSITSGSLDITVRGEYDYDKWEYVYVPYKVAGIIKTEYNYSGNSKVKEVTPRGDSYDTRGPYSSNTERKAAAVLTISDGTKAAKFSFSVSDGSKSKGRSSEWNGGDDRSDIGVYDSNNKLQYTIPAIWAADNIDAFYNLGSSCGYIKRASFYYY